MKMIQSFTLINFFVINCILQLLSIFSVPHGERVRTCEVRSRFFFRTVWNDLTSVALHSKLFLNEALC